MSLTPAFEIGLWNAWIFTLYYVALGPILMSLINKEASKKLKESPQLSDTERKLGNFGTVIWLGGLIYSIFVPLQLGRTWFYVGLPICSTALIMSTIILVNIINTPPDEPFTKGLYRYSRHPIYLSQFLLFLGIGVACASWIFLLFATLLISIQRILVVSEEWGCLEKYGDAYREYAIKTPRWLGRPKSEKW